jgi:hypothetical protein
MNEYCQVTFSNVSNCITFCADLVHMVKTMKIASGRSINMQRISCMRNSDEIGPNIKNDYTDLHAVDPSPKAL